MDQINCLLWITFNNKRVHGHDYSPGETFRVLEEKGEHKYGEYRTAVSYWRPGIRWMSIKPYEINFNRYFYRYTPPRPLEEIEADIRAIEQDIISMLREVTESPPKAI